METAQFEIILTKAVEILGEDVRTDNTFHDPHKFEERVRHVLALVAKDQGIEVNPTFHPHAFPDIRANGFGVEAKTTSKDSWRTVGNSIFEGMRDPSVTQIYVVFGKMGGMPSVRWGRYEERIAHVRFSHAPRFVLDMEDESDSLFASLSVNYVDFCNLSSYEKMNHVRSYSRAQLRPGERLWWLEDESGSGVELEVKLYMNLSNDEKIKLRAEGAILCPQICGGSRVKNKYHDVALFFLTYHNVFAPQTRDLFTAGSVAGKARGGNYLQRSLKNIEPQMIEAALRLDDALIEEYWGISVAPENRIKEWLLRADSYAKKWKPSDVLFTDSEKAKGLFP